MGYFGTICPGTKCPLTTIGWVDDDDDDDDDDDSSNWFWPSESCFSTEPSSLSPTPFNKCWWGLSWYFYADDVDDVDDFDDVDDVDDVDDIDDVDDVDDIDDIDFDDADQSCQNLSGRSLMHWCWCTVFVYLEYLVVISVFGFSAKLP